MKCVIAGSRNFSDYYLMETVLEQFPEITEVLSGTANGADVMGELWAQSKGIPVSRYPAQWDTYGRQAGHLRNGVMLDEADSVICFWDGHSAGTRNMAGMAEVQDKLIHLETYNTPTFNAIFAVGPMGEFGLNGELPWPFIEEDMKVFVRATKGCHIIMGGSTASSIPLDVLYAHDKTPVVVTSKHLTYSMSTIDSSDDIIDTMANYTSAGLCWLIGGKSVLTLENLKRCDSIILTRVKQCCIADTFMPKEIVDWVEGHPSRLILETDKVTIRRYQIAKLS